jgi:hypothetical protein
VHPNLAPLLFFDQVTDAGMEEIGTQCTQLTQLSLAECDNVQVRRVKDLGNSDTENGVAYNPNNERSLDLH